MSGWMEYKKENGEKPTCPQCRKIIEITKIRSIYYKEANKLDISKCESAMTY